MSPPVLLRDPLTGAYSRAALEPRLAEEAERASRYNAPFALLLIDLDHFKSINDAFGHARGDELLAAFVARLHTALRASDLLFRYGGDEFVLLLPATPRAAGRALADRLLALIASEPFAGAPPLRCSGSIGVAFCPDDGATPAALFAQADARMYEAKRRGRGCVVDEGHGMPDALDFSEGGRLIERDAATQALREFLDALQEQRRGALAISGVVGSGRTRLLLELRHLARLRGYVVALVCGAPGLRTRVYGALDEARQQWPAPEAAYAEPQALVRALLDLCDQPESAGLLLLVDDPAQIDAATLDLLREAALAPTVPVALVYTVLPGRTFPEQDDAPLQRRIELPPFSLAGVQLWLRSALRGEASAALSQWLFEGVGGLPGALRRALSQLEAQGALAPTAEGWALRAETPEVPVGARLLPQPPAHALPELLADFIGRGADIRAIKQQLAAHALLTLVGPGGIGKTRLALQAAAELAPRFADGACFVSLATVADAGSLALALIAALGLKLPDRHEPGAFLIDYLHGKSLLLVVDNLEQLRGELGLLAALLRQAPFLRLLATSREALELPGEALWELRGLPFPTADGATEIERYGAGQLFLQRARRVAPHFALAAPDRPAVRAICQLVEGVPLGLELAAAWVGLFSCAEIAHAIRTKGDFLNGAPASSPGEGRSLRAVFDYFWSQLSPDEQRVVRWLAVFRGSFTREMARDVAGASPFLLSALVNKAFLHPVGDGRYVLHELLRQHAAAMLAPWPGEHWLAHQRHATCYAALAEGAAPLLLGPDQAAWLARLDAEQSNLRAVFEWSLGAEEEARRHRNEESASPAAWFSFELQSETGLRLAAALWPYWVYRAQVREAREWLTRLLRLPVAQAPNLHRARLLNAAGFMAMRQGAWREAEAQLDESIALAKRHGSTRDLLWALNHRGYAAKGLGEPGRAEGFQLESLRLAREMSFPWHAAWALSGLGDLAQTQGDYARARPLLEEALAIFRALGDRFGVASLLLGLGQGALGQGDGARARPLLEECRQICEALGDLSGVAAALAHLGEIALREGDAAGGAALLLQSLALRSNLGDRQGIAHCFAALADAAAARDQRHKAAWLRSAADGSVGDIDAAVRQALAWG